MVHYKLGLQLVFVCTFVFILNCNGRAWLFKLFFIFLREIKNHVHKFLILFIFGLSLYYLITKHLNYFIPFLFFLSFKYHYLFSINIFLFFYISGYSLRWRRQYSFGKAHQMLAFVILLWLRDLWSDAFLLEKLFWSSFIHGWLELFDSFLRKISGDWLFVLLFWSIRWSRSILKIFLAYLSILQSTFTFLFFHFNSPVFQPLAFSSSSSSIYIYIYMLFFHNPLMIILKNLRLIPQLINRIIIAMIIKG